MDQWNKGGLSREEFLRMRETAMRQLQEMAKNHPMPQMGPPRKEQDIRKQQPAGTVPTVLIQDAVRLEPEREAFSVTEPVSEKLPMTEPEPELESMPMLTGKGEHEAADPAFLDMLGQVNEAARMLERQWEADAAKVSLEQAPSVPLYQPEIRFSVEREEMPKKPDQWAGQKLPLWEPPVPRQEDEWMAPVLPSSTGRQDLPLPPGGEEPWMPPVPAWEEKPSTVYHPDGALAYKMPKNAQYHPDAGVMEQGARSFRRAGRRRISLWGQEGAKKK